MKRRQRLPELLAPAGSFDALLAAVAAGADAVYLGTDRFNARAFAENFGEGGLRRAVRYAHAQGVRVHVTLNTLLGDRDLPDFLRTAEEVTEAGADAAIVADLGAISLLRRYFPELPLHASTQAAVHSAIGAQALCRLGVCRVVAARECSADDLRAMVEQSDPEIEMFVHGALCVSHSGQCLFSSMVGGRSGNLGQCAQPCRLGYRHETEAGKPPDDAPKSGTPREASGFPLSLRDLSLAGQIPAIVASGVASLKIEGRMKSPDYVFGVTRIYRRLLDEGRAATKEEEDTLRRLFSRGGFTDAYYTGSVLQVPMGGVRSDADKADSRRAAGLPLAAWREEAERTLAAKEGATDQGAIPQHSSGANRSSAAAPAERTPTQTVSGADNTATAAADSPASLKIRSVGSPQSADAALPPVTALFLRAEQWNAVAALRAGRQNKGDILLPDRCYLPLWQLPRAKTLPDGIALPPVIPDRETEGLRRALRAAADRGIRYALCGNVGSVALAREYGFWVQGDFRCNILNAPAAEAWRALGVDDCMVSPEATLPQARDLHLRVPVYGRIPLMLLERCVTRLTAGCRGCDNTALVDRRGARFPLMREWQHRCLLLNSLPTYMGDRRAELARAGLSLFHLMFTTESPDECIAVLRALGAGAPLPCEVRRLGRKDAPPSRAASQSERDGTPLGGVKTRPTRKDPPPAAKPAAKADQPVKKGEMTHADRRQPNSPAAVGQSAKGGKSFSSFKSGGGKQTAHPTGRQRVEQGKAAHSLPRHRRGKVR